MAVDTQQQDRPPQSSSARSAPDPPSGIGSWARGLFILLIVLGVVAGAAYGGREMLGSFTAANVKEITTHTVKKGELLVSVTEDGNVESAKNVDIKCGVAGGSSILWIVPDGEFVKQGDKLVELESSQLEEQINTQRIQFGKARSAMVQAQKDHEVAKISVKEYLEGLYLRDLQDADAQITIAMENLRSAQNSLGHTKKMFRKGYVSSLEHESQQFAVKRSQLELDAANTAKKVLTEFTKAKTMEELKSQVETAKAKMESELAAFNLEKQKLERLEAQLKNCTILAPQSGMVVYANERSRFGQQSASIEEGAAVRERQTMLRLPDLEQMQVKVKVHETKVEDLTRGMRARVQIQDREMQGEVTSIANQPEPTSWFSGSVKEYGTIVKIDGGASGDKLKPGMTAEVEILVAHLKDVLSVPVAAVVEQRGKFYCWVKKGAGKPERRPLVLGLTNEKYVEIKDGLADGDEVVMNPRAFVEEARENSEAEEEGVDVGEKFGASPGGPPGAGRGPGAGQGPGGPEGSGARGGGRGPGAAGGGRGGGGRQGGGGGGRQGGGGGGRQGAGGRNLMQYDKDSDGKISKDEAPSWMQSFFDRIDANSDGFVDDAEAKAMRNRSGGGGRGEGGGGRGRGEGGSGRGRGEGGGGRGGQ